MGCKTPGCGRAAAASGLCNSCYARMWREKRRGPMKRKSPPGSAGALIAEAVTTGTVHSHDAMELKRLKEAYENAVGLDARLRLRRQIAKLERGE